MREFGKAEIELHVQVVIGGERREARGHQAFAQLFRGRDAQRPAVQERARSALCGIQIVACGIVDHARNDFVAKGEAEGDAVNREAVRVVRRSVQGIDVPAVVG